MIAEVLLIDVFLLKRNLFTQVDKIIQLDGFSLVSFLNNSSRKRNHQGFFSTLVFVIYFEFIMIKVHQLENNLLILCHKHQQ